MPESVGPSGTLDVNVRLIGSRTLAPSDGDVMVSFGALPPEFAPVEPQAATASSPTRSNGTYRMWRGIRILLERRRASDGCTGGRRRRDFSAAGQTGSGPRLVVPEWP